VKRKANRKWASAKPQPDATTDILWSVLFKTAPQTIRRKRAVILLTLVVLSVPPLFQFWSHGRPAPPPPPPQSAPSISQEGGIHIGDNVAGDQISIELPPQAATK
jgi:hypothetical protein